MVDHSVNLSVNGRNYHVYFVFDFSLGQWVVSSAFKTWDRKWLSWFDSTQQAYDRGHATDPCLDNAEAVRLALEEYANTSWHKT
jgi:hypothetical protein